MADVLSRALVCRGWGSLGSLGSTSWPSPGPYGALTPLVWKMKLWMVPLSMVPALSGWVRRVPPARLGWDYLQGPPEAWVCRRPPILHIKAAWGSWSPV